MPKWMKIIKLDKNKSIYYYSYMITIVKIIVRFLNVNGDGNLRIIRECEMSSIILRSPDF